MQTATITSAQLPISKIGLGCVTFGREIDEEAAHAMLDHAWARGVVHFDTAAAYGEGRSESIVGRWLASRRPAKDSISIATKIRPPFVPEHLEAAVEGCMKRLGVPVIDLLYLHQWHATAETAAALGVLDALVRSGKVRALGMSNCAQQQLGTLLAMQRHHGFARFSVVQNNHNLAVRDVSERFRQFCAAYDVAIVTYSPLGAGFLTSKHKRGVESGSRFDLVPGHQDVYFHRTSYRRLERLEAIAARTSLPQSHLALSWALQQPGVDCVLVGGRAPAQLDQAFAALEFQDASLMDELSSDDP